MTENRIKVFTAKACAKPLTEAARKFAEQENVAVDVAVCSRHCAETVARDMTVEEERTPGQPESFLEEIAGDPELDIVIAGAEYLLDDAEDMKITVPGTRVSLGLRRSVILVGKGNPLRITGIEDLTRSGVRVAVSVIDCLKGAWEDICGRAGLVETDVCCSAPCSVKSTTKTCGARESRSGHGQE